MKKNKSTTYLLPLMLVEFNATDVVFQKYIINTYLFLEKYHFPNCLILEVSNNPDDKNFCRFRDLLFVCKNYDTYYETRDGRLIFAMRFDRYLPEYKLYLEGKYSHFSNAAKNVIYRYFKSNPRTVLFAERTKDILYREPSLKRELEEKLNVTLREDAELSSIYDENLETLNDK